MQIPNFSGGVRTDPPDEPAPEQPSASILERTTAEQTHPAGSAPQAPTPGRIVHYNGASGPIPAIITHVPDSVSDEFGADRPADGRAHLVLFSAWLQPNGTNVALNVQYGDGPGEWSWPPRQG